MQTWLYQSSDSNHSMASHCSWDKRAEADALTCLQACSSLVNLPLGCSPSPAESLLQIPELDLWSPPGQSLRQHACPSLCPSLPLHPADNLVSFGWIVTSSMGKLSLASLNKSHITGFLCTICLSVFSTYYSCSFMIICISFISIPLLDSNPNFPRTVILSLPPLTLISPAPRTYRCLIIVAGWMNKWGNKDSVEKCT